MQELFLFKQIYLFCYGNTAVKWKYLKVQGAISVIVLSFIEKSQLTTILTQVLLIVYIIQNIRHFNKVSSYKHMTLTFCNLLIFLIKVYMFEKDQKLIYLILVSKLKSVQCTVELITIWCMSLVTKLFF